MIKQIGLIFVTASLFVFGFFTIVTDKAYAVTASDWKAGNIIDDAVFTNVGSMNISQIQEFLNNKVPICDTLGTNGSTPTSRRDYAISLGYNIPFTCLKDYYEVPKTTPSPNLPANNYGGKPIPAGAKSAAELIWDAAQKYNISPAVLLVKLGTESAGPLTSDTWPSPSQYTYAMGAHCPDSGPNGTANCDTNYSGFSIQISEAAALLRGYLNNMTQPWWTNKKPYQVNSIYWNVVPSGCGAADVYIKNKATAALYTYTPYQPNPAALNNMYGTGDGCSAYGNRNFWSTFNNWFGSTQAINANVTLSKPLSLDTSNQLVRGNIITASYEVSNSADYDVSAGGLGICARINGNWYDFGFNDQNIIPARGKITLSYTKTLDQAGTLDIITCSYNASIGGWASLKYPYNTDGLQRTLSSTVQDNPLVTSSVTLTPASPAAGQPVTATMNITNASASPVNIGLIVMAARDSTGKNVDFPFDKDVIIPANSTYNYSETKTFTSPGTYSIFIANLRNNVWSMAYPKSRDSAILRSTSFTIK